ncbi:probable basic-leucine zipper transcription factor K [Nematostella vectensis]|nr:probable basic-leucine zipper transcription factor K [Nematostella vectensis]
MFNVDSRAVRDHLGNLIKKYKKQMRAEERASGIAPDEPSELDQLIKQIIELEETTVPEDSQRQAKEKANKAKAEDVRLTAMERLSQTKKRDFKEGDVDVEPKRQKRKGGDAIEFLKERADKNSELREKELNMKKEMQQQQLQLQQKNTEMMQAMVQQQQQQQQQQQMLMMQQFIGVMGKMLNK